MKRADVRQDKENKCRVFEMESWGVITANALHIVETRGATQYALYRETFTIL